MRRHLFLLVLLLTPHLTFAGNPLVVQLNQDSRMSLLVNAIGDSSLAPARFGAELARDWLLKPADSNGFLALLGKTENSLWTLEGNIDNDANGLIVVSLVETTKLGKRISHSVIDSKEALICENEKNCSQKAYDLILKRLWTLEKQNTFPSKKLRVMPGPPRIQKNTPDAPVRNTCDVLVDLSNEAVCFSLNYSGGHVFEFAWKVSVTKGRPTATATYAGE